MEEGRKNQPGQRERRPSVRIAHPKEGAKSPAPRSVDSSSTSGRIGRTLFSSDDKGAHAKPTRRTAPPKEKSAASPKPRTAQHQSAPTERTAKPKTSKVPSFNKVASTTGAFPKAPSKPAPAQKKSNGAATTQQKPKKPVEQKPPKQKRADQKAKQQAAAATRKKATRTSVKQGSDTVSKPRFVMIAVVSVLVVAMLIDVAGSIGKVHHGVRVGDVNVGGLTQAEAAQKIESSYVTMLDANPVYVLASPDATPPAVTAAAFDGSGDESYAQSIVDNPGSSSWVIPAASVGAHVDAEALAEQAYDSCHGVGGMLSRLTSWFVPVRIEPKVFFDDERTIEMLYALTSVNGVNAVDANITIEGIDVAIHDGNDGIGTSLSDFKANMAAAFLAKKDRGFVFSHDVIPQSITPAEAEVAAEQVRAAIATPVSVTYEGGVWNLDPERIGSWTSFVRVSEGDEMVLRATLDPHMTTAGLEDVLGDVGTAPTNAEFAEDAEGHAYVSPSQPGEGPNLEIAVTKLADMLYGDEFDGSPVQLDLETELIPPTVTTEMLESYDITALLSSYTTEFNSGADRVNNINQASRYLNGIVLEPGEKFSFNDIVGERTPARGFAEAGTLVGDQIVDEVGGGICQVATTVFNAAYEAGLPIPVRFNHTKYMYNYPDGRDAAVSWPDLDLQFTNDTDGIIYIAAKATDKSITIELWGTATGRTVSSQMGEWQKGKEFKKVTRVDKDYPTGYSEIEQRGVDGSSVVIYRTVLNADGSVHFKDQFTSTYLPVNEVTVKGPDKKEEPKS